MLIPNKNNLTIMQIIIGLGNPEEKFGDTRHNTGFLFVDKIKEKYALPEFEFKKNFQAEIAKGKIGEAEILLVKPQTFMNLSGEAAQAILNFYKITPDNLLVIHDDLDIKLGNYKLATDSSSAGHNGVQNIIDCLGTQKFRRLRIGIGQKAEEDEPACRLEAHDFVLAKFSSEELHTLNSLAEEIIKNITTFM